MSKSLKNKNVVMANPLVRAAQCLTLNEKRVVMAAVAKMQGVNQEITISAEEFASTYGLTINETYECLKEGVLHLRKRWVSMQIRDVDAKGRECLWIGEANWTQGAFYNKGLGSVRFKFSDYVHPYLFDLQKNFTAYKLSQASSLRSVHSWRLLELFEQQNIFDKDGYRWLKLSIDEAHHAFESGDSYKKTFGLFRKYVLETAIKELILKDNWLIEFTPIKRGRKFEMLEFRYKRNEQLALNFS